MGDDIASEDLALYARYLAALHQSERFLKAQHIGYGDVIAWQSGSDAEGSALIGMVAHPWVLPILEDGPVLWRRWAQSEPEVYIMVSYASTFENTSDALVLVAASSFLLLQVLRRRSRSITASQLLRATVPSFQFPFNVDPFRWLRRQLLRVQNLRLLGDDVVLSESLFARGGVLGDGGGAENDADADKDSEAPDEGLSASEP